MFRDGQTVERAQNADLVTLLEELGYSFFNYSDGHRCREHPSLIVYNDRRSWYWNSQKIGGSNAIDFYIMTEKMSFNEAVDTTLSGSHGVLSAQKYIPLEMYITPRMPATSRNDNQLLIDYLCNERCIGIDIVDELIREEKIYEDERGNVVFVRYDKYGIARSITQRGTMRGQVFHHYCADSDKRYGFYMPSIIPSELLYIFESPIDAMSHATLINMARQDTLAWREQSRIALSGTSDTALTYLADLYPKVRELVFCLDNDPAGQEAAETHMKKYAEMGYRTRRLIPKGGKDYNEKLQARCRQSEAKTL